MNAPARGSLIGRLLWSLCLMQVVVMLCSLAGALYHLIDNRITFIDDAVVETLVEAVEVRPDGPGLVDSDALRDLQAEHADLWAVVVDSRGHREQLGRVPEQYRSLVERLPSLLPSQLHATREQIELTMRIEVKEVDGESVHLMVGGAAASDFNLLIFQFTSVLSPYFLIPLILFTLIATPIVVWRATRGVRRLAREASALDISKLDTQLTEDSVPREIRPLVSAFNDAMQRLSKTYHARDRFLRDAAHELRMPIAVLMARIDGMPTHPLKPILLTDLARLANVAEQLLDLQRLQTPSLALVPVDLVALAREIVSEVAPLALARCDDLVLNAPDEPVWVLGQASSLNRVITNLIQNALVHGGGCISLSVSTDGSFVVADQGPGIAEEEREQIFQPFHRGSVDTPGHGLGLHLVQEIVRAHQGRISVANGADGGAQFSVQLVRLPSPDR